MRFIIIFLVIVIVKTYCNNYFRKVLYTYNQKINFREGYFVNAYNQPYVIPGISIKREDDTLFIAFKNKEKEKVRLYVGRRPEVQSINYLLEQNDTGKFQIELPIALAPYYFIIKTSSYQTSIFGERVLPLKKAINVRDMGGYKTKDGKYTKWGLLYRGDQLSKLGSEDVDLLERVGLKTIVDYRSAHERSINPNKSISTVKKVVHCDPSSSFSEAAANAADLNEENIKLVKQLENGDVDPKYINGKGENVIEDYRHTVTSETAKIAYENFLKACSNTENAPLIHHCRGGKDRTGLGSMFLLLLLGVEQDEIIKDYTLTGIIRKERNDLKYNLYKELTQNEDYLAYLMAMIETREEFIQASIDRIYELYDTAEEYFIQHFGITKDEIEQMKEFYLEEEA